MPDPNTEVPANPALVRLRRLSALPEPDRTAKIIRFARRACWPSLVALVNGLHVDRFNARHYWQPVDPKKQSPDWASELPIEFFVILNRRLWPVAFRSPATMPEPAASESLRGRLTLLRTRRLAGTSMWHPDDVLAWDDSGRRGLTREADGRRLPPSERRERMPSPLRSSIDEPRDDSPETDQQLVHEWMCRYVYGKECGPSMREIVDAGIRKRDVSDRIDSEENDHRREFLARRGRMGGIANAANFGGMTPEDRQLLAKDATPEDKSEWARRSAKTKFGRMTPEERSEWGRHLASLKKRRPPAT